MKNVLLIELNEVPNLILDRYVAHRPQSAMARFLGSARRFRTEMTHEGMLEPWTACPTFHRGVPNNRHRIFSLGQPLESVDREFPPVWQLLHEAGRRVGVFGSLHARMPREGCSDYAFFVPDFFSPSFEVYPAKLAPYQEFNLAMTWSSKHSVSSSLPLGLTTRFLANARSLGVRWKTFRSLGLQLGRELIAPHLKSRRRAYQHMIMSDIFMNMLEETRPEFATFLTNYVATALHRFWAAAFPDDYAYLPLSPQYRRRFRDEVFWSLDAFDVLLARLLEFAARQGYLVSMASAFGQAPIPTYHSFRFVSIVDMTRFMDCLGFPPGTWKNVPTMTPHFSIAVAQEDAPRMNEALRTLSIGQYRMVHHNDIQWPMSFQQPAPGFFSIYFSLDDYSGEQVVELGAHKIAFERAGLGFNAHENGIEYTAYHTREGSLAVYDPEHPSADDTVHDIAAEAYVPSLLRYFGAEVPSYMVAPAAIFPLPEQQKGKGL